MVIDFTRTRLGKGCTSGHGVCGVGSRSEASLLNVVLGGGIFGVGWGLSGICPGTAYASPGVGNLTILYAILGMFAGAYVQGYVRSHRDPAGGVDNARSYPDLFQTVGHKQ